MYVANKWKLQEHLRANKQIKLWRYFTIQIVRQNMPFISWGVQYASYSMSVKTRYYSTLNWTVTGKDVKDPKAILADKHFQKSGHRFNKLARFTIINRLTNTKLGKEILILLKMGWGAKRPHYQFFTYNFYKCGN